MGFTGDLIDEITSNPTDAEKELTDAEQKAYYLCLWFLFDRALKCFEVEQKNPNLRKSGEDIKNALEVMDSISRIFDQRHFGPIPEDEIKKFKDDPRKFIKTANSLAQLITNTFNNCVSPVLDGVPEGTRDLFKKLKCDALAKACPR